MKLYHCFPRRSGNLVSDERDRLALGIKILENIIRFGFLCTPERMRIYPPPLTPNAEKKELLRRGEPELMVVQSCFCATLCESPELFASRYGHETSTHVGLFVPMAIGLDPIRSRQMGFVPTVYYTRRPIPAFAERGMREFATQVELIQRLKEVRDVLIALAHVEAGLEIEDFRLPTLQMLDALKLGLTYESDVTVRLRGTPAAERREILRLFDTDREIALNLVGVVEVLLSLFQEADSSIDESFLSFFEQREWRIVHQMRSGTSWYCLGHRPGFMNPLSDEMREDIADLRDFLDRHGGPRPEGFFENTWVRVGIDVARPAEFIDEVIVPGALCSKAREMFWQAGLRPEIMASEDIAGSEPKEPV